MKPKLDSHRVMELTKLVDYALQKGKPATHFRLFERLYLSALVLETYLGKPTPKTMRLLRMQFINLSNIAGERYR
jgi:hypothetical protein